MTITRVWSLSGGRQSVACSGSRDDTSQEEFDALVKAHPRYLVNGQSVSDREKGWAYPVAVASGSLHLSYFVSLKTENAVKVVNWTGDQAAGATPSVARFGLFEEDPDTYDLTLIGSTAHDATLWANTFTRYERTLTAPAPLVAGRNYAIAPLVVSAAAIPRFMGVQVGGASVTSAQWYRAPRKATVVLGQTDLPASLLEIDLTTGSRVLYNFDILNS